MVASCGAVFPLTRILLSFLQENNRKEKNKTKPKTLAIRELLSSAKINKLSIYSVRRDLPAECYRKDQITPELLHPLRIILEKQRDCLYALEIIEHSIVLIGGVNVVRIKPETHEY